MALQSAKTAASKPVKRQTAVAASTATGSSSDPKPNSGSQPNAPVGLLPAPVSADARRAMIAEAAYYLAEQRGFAQGKELDDWLLAEKRIDGSVPA